MRTKKTDKTTLNKKIPLRPLTPKILIDHRTGKVPVWASVKEKQEMILIHEKEKNCYTFYLKDFPDQRISFPNEEEATKQADEYLKEGYKVTRI
ncbi:MAG: hypothetical protein LKJ88_04430 [Bacilli bacterium]|jgi:hypothetical protein|nr:hypothetical protein [Bacilli bacterium]